MPSASSQKQIPLRHCVISTVAHSKTQGSMYQDEPVFQTHLHQQPQHLAPREVATTLWPQQTSNYWFPNWRELFHGFIVVQGSQPRQAPISSFEPNQAAACTQQDTRSFPSPFSRTGNLHFGTDHPTKPTCHSAQPSQQQISSPVPSSGAHTPHSRLDDVTQSPHPGATVSHTAAQSPTLLDQTKKDDAHINCPPSQPPGSLTKYTIKSPFWLPQGWVTEIQMRKTGTATSKYYKHLASGRRFRTRTEVLRFISTGKGRTRTRDRCNKSLALTAASFSLMNNFAHKKHTTFATSKLFLPSIPPGSSENSSPTNVENPLLTGPSAELRPNGETGPPSKQYICISAGSGIGEPENSQLQSKHPAQEKTQKLPVKKKAKTLGEDEQTCKIWQWFKQPGSEPKASEAAEQRIGNELSLQDTASQKTAQLGREIQAAHMTMVQMSKEMQATAEKLSREIREAQKDVELHSDSKLLGAPAERDVPSVTTTDEGRICRDTKTAPRPCTMTNGVVQVSPCLHNATKNQAIWFNSAAGYVPHVTQKPDNTKGLLKQVDKKRDTSPQATDLALSALNREESFSIFCIKHATQPTNRPEITSNQPIQRAHGSHTAKGHVDTSSHTIVPVETAFLATVSGIQPGQLHVLAPIHVTEVTVGDVIRPALWPGVLTPNVAQPTEIANPGGSSTAAKATGTCAYMSSYVPQPAHIAHAELTNRTQAPQRYVVTRSHHSKQPAQVDSAEMGNNVEKAQGQTARMGPLLPTTERPDSSIGHVNAALHNPAIENAMGDAVPKYAGGGPSNPLHAVQVRACSAAGTEIHEEIARRRYQDRKARRLRRKKFAAVLNPKLDLSRLDPALTARQRAKAVERMKTRHARELLAALGLHLCRKAIRRKPWLA